MGHPRKSKPVEIETILNRRLFTIVNNKHRLVTHKDGHLLLFHRKKDAQRWLLNNDINDTWRVEKLEILVTKV